MDHEIIALIALGAILLGAAIWESRCDHPPSKFDEYPFWSWF